ncbi:putative autotransporter protein [Trabulsiella guamensis ATCC 49490]|uniref:Putative autotransporter protein n=1 Tax=Trabulsiella guamensis ATCC 49490 TaxID=1005994 RepID=A0A085A2Q9_9ENTR|nr:autotransporter outer membrane beta-barrel domain-containing protein [Trabulsiella guamensis]KFC04504.1 putative autotransporter protein [Trabulsiella guamensis ATCC 49490]
MNRIYRVIWNRVLNVFQVCSELVRGQGKSSSDNQTRDANPILSQENIIRLPFFHSGILSLMIFAVLSGQASAVSTIDGGKTVNVISTAYGDYFLTIGITGEGTLNILSGGEVTGPETEIVSIGRDKTAKGTVNVDGTGSVLNTGGLNVGQVGSGTLNVTNAGSVNTAALGVVAGTTGGTGLVRVNTGGQWNLVNSAGALQDLNVGYGGSGIINIESAGSVTAGMTTIGSFESGIGTVTVDGAGSAMNTGALRVGDYGEGTLSITDSGRVVSSGASLLARSPGGSGTVNVNTGGEWNIVNTAGTGQALNVGYEDEGVLNIQSAGKVKAGATTLGGNDGATGTVNLDGAGSVMDVTSLRVGGDTSSEGTITLSNAGTLNIAPTGSLSIGAATGSTGTVNIGAAQGQTAAAAGYITGSKGVILGGTSGTLVFNHTASDPSIAGGYQFTHVISGKGTLIQDAGHTVLSGNNSFTGTTLINGGTLTTNTQSSTNRSGLGSSAVAIDSAGTLEVRGTTSTSTGNFNFINALSGMGLIDVDLAATDDIFAFTSSVGSAFAGTVDLKKSTFALSGANTLALKQATLVSSAGNTTTVGNGAQTIGGLTFAGGNMVFNATAPDQKKATSHVTATTLDASGAGTVQINVPALYVPGEDSDTTTSLMTQDDANTGVQLIGATQVTGSGANLVLQDQNGNTLTDATLVDIAQDGNTVAKGTYDYRLTTTGASGNQDGLYVNYGLAALELLQDQTLTLAVAPGATGSAADQSARITGSGNLATRAAEGEVVSLSNSNNDYSGATRVLTGTLRTDADGALGNTSELNIISNAITDLNGTVQTVGMLTGQADSILNVNGGTLILQNGGLSDGSLTGAGNLTIDGGVLTISGANSDLSVATTISSGAQVSINDVQGAGTGDITDDGTLTLDGVTGMLVNNISGTGNVDATNTTDITLTGDNSDFSGLFTIDSGSNLTVSEQKNLGTATVSGAGDLTKTGSGVLTLAQNSAAWTGTTEILGGEIALGDKTTSPVDMASQLVNIHDGAILSGYGSTAGDINVMQGGTMQVYNFSVGNHLTNSGQVLLNRPGMQPGNALTVNGNYTGDDGLMAFNTVLGDDDSLTDKLTVQGDTAGSTRVTVNNVGGTGAQTVNGIELVQVDGNSAGNFALTTGTVEAGAYVYTLAKGTGDAAKNWYLTSKWTGSVTPPDDPVPPVEPVKPPVVDPTAPDALRPEAGSYISNIAAANTLFNHRLHDRLGEPQYTDVLRNGDSHATSMWMRHVGGHERSSAGDGQLKTRSNRYVLQLGGDIAQWSSDGLDRWHLGVMGGYANEHSNTRSDRAGYGSDGRVSGYSAGLYGTWYQNDAGKTGAYVDSWMLYNWFDSSVTAENRDSDEYKSKGLTASLEAGYTLKAGEFTGSQGTLNTWYVQPQAQVTWMGVKDKTHTRNDGTRIETEGDGNIQTRLGVRTYLNSHHKMDDGKQREFQPFVEVNWIHNTESFGVKMDGQRVSRDGARNLGEIRTGVEGKLNDRLSVWGNVGVQMGDKGYSDTQGMLGVKYSW